MRLDFFNQKKYYSQQICLAAGLVLALGIFIWSAAGAKAAGDLNQAYFSQPKEYSCFSSADDQIGKKITVKSDTSLPSADFNPHKLKISSANPPTEGLYYCSDGQESGLVWNGQEISELRIKLGAADNDNLQKIISTASDSLPGASLIKNFPKNEQVFLGVFPVSQADMLVQFRYLDNESNPVALAKGKAAKIGVGGADTEKVKKIEVIFQPKSIAQAAFKRVIYLTWGDQKIISQGQYKIQGKVKQSGRLFDRPYRAVLALVNGQKSVNSLVLPYVDSPLVGEYEYIDGRVNRYDRAGNYLGYSILSGQEKNFWQFIWNKPMLKEKTWYGKNDQPEKFESYNLDGSLAAKALFDERGCFNAISEYDNRQQVSVDISVEAASCSVDSQTKKLSYKADKYLMPGRIWTLTQVYKNEIEDPTARRQDEQAMVKAGQEILKALQVEADAGYEAGAIKILRQIISGYQEDISGISRRETDKNLRQAKIYEKYLNVAEELKRAFWGLENLLDSNVKYAPELHSKLVAMDQLSKDQNGQLVLGFWLMPQGSGQSGDRSVFLNLTNETSVKKILDNLKVDWSGLKSLEKLSQSSGKPASATFLNKLALIGNFLRKLFINEAQAASCTAADEYDNCRYGGIRTDGGLRQMPVNETDPSLIGGGYFYGDSGKFYFYNMFTNQSNGGYIAMDEFMKPDPTINKLLNEFLNSETAQLSNNGQDISTVSDLQLVRDFYRYFAAKPYASYKYDKSEAYQTVGETIARGGGNCGDFAMFAMNGLYNLFKKLGRNAAADNLYYTVVMIKNRASGAIGGHAVITFYNSADAKWYYIEPGIIIQGVDTAVYSDVQLVPQINMSGGDPNAYNDAYSYVANWDLTVYFYVNAQSVYHYFPERPFYVQGTQSTSTVLGFTGQPAGTNRGGSIASISSQDIYITPNDAKVNQLATLINNTITSKISAAGLAVDPISIINYANREFAQIVSYVPRSDYDTWRSAADTLTQKYGSSLPDSLASLQSNKLTGDCDILAFVEASVMRNLLQRYYQSQGFSDYVAKAKNNLVVLGAAGHLDLGYIGDYKFDYLTGLAVFDYINGKLNLMKYSDYIAAVPTTNTPALFFSSCNQTVAIGSSNTNWSKYTTNLIIAIFFRCSALGESLFGSCGSGSSSSSSSSSSVGSQSGVPPGNPESPCQDTTRISCPASASGCNKDTLHCAICACYVDAGACSTPIGGTPPQMSSISAQTATVGQDFEFNVYPYATATDGDPIEEIDCSLIGASNGSYYDTTVPGIKFSAYADTDGTTKFSFFGVPTTTGTHSCNNLKVRDKDGWSNSVTFTINVVDTRLPRFVVPNQIAVQNDSFTLGLANYVIKGASDILEYRISGLPSGLSLNTSTGLISGAPTSLGTYTVTPEARNSAGWGSGSFTILVGQKVSGCEASTAENMYRVNAGVTAIVLARTSSGTRCVKIANTSNKDIMVPNKSLGEFDSFDNSNWKVGGSSAVSNVTYAYGPWSSGSFNSSNFTMSHTRSCLRNDNVAVDCSYCGGICSYTSAATYIDTHASYTGWRCGGHGGDIYVYWNHYYIDGQPFSHSWINCGIPWGYQVTFSGTYQTWDSYFSVYIPPSD